VAGTPKAIWAQPVAGWDTPRHEAYMTC